MTQHTSGKRRSWQVSISSCTLLLASAIFFIGCSKQNEPTEAPDLSALPVAQKPVDGFDVLKSREIGNPIEGQPWITHIQAIDTNADELVDILVCDAFNNTVSVIENRGNGNFEERALAEVQSPVHTDLVDIDADGDLDILVASMGYLFPNNEKIGSVVALENLDNGSYTKRVLIEGIARVTDVRASDLDGDGLVDLAVAQFGYMQGEARWMRNLGNWNFESEILIELPGAINVCLNDFDNNGATDIAILISQDSEEIRIFFNNGKGQFEDKVIFASTNEDFGSSNIRLGDLNSDGRMDILYTNGDGFDLAYPGPRPWHGVQWLENLGKGDFSYHRLIDFPGAYSPVALDFDYDGDQDLLSVSCFSDWSNLDSTSLLLLRNDGDERFIPVSLATKPTHIVSLDTADFDGDGIDELVTAGFHVYPPFDRMARVILWEKGSK